MQHHRDLNKRELQLDCNDDGDMILAGCKRMEYFFFLFWMMADPAFCFCVQRRINTISHRPKNFTGLIDKNDLVLEDGM